MAVAALSFLVGKNQDSFRFCSTPDCGMVYCISKDGRQFECACCGTSLCTTCHILFHEGLTCAMYQSAKTGEGNIDMWIIENSRRDFPVGVPLDLSTPTGMSCIGTYGENCKSDNMSKYRVLLVAFLLLWHEN